jgi:hypothetical protein
MSFFESQEPRYKSQEPRTKSQNQESWAKIAALIIFLEFLNDKIRINKVSLGSWFLTLQLSANN